MTDKRVRMMHEIISGIRLIKMYAWEWAFHEYVNKIRKLVAIIQLNSCSKFLPIVIEKRAELLLLQARFRKSMQCFSTLHLLYLLLSLSPPMLV